MIWKMLLALILLPAYPDAVIFDGQKEEFSFLTQTPAGIKRVRYYSGLLEDSLSQNQ